MCTVCCKLFIFYFCLYCAFEAFVSFPDQLQNVMLHFRCRICIQTLVRDITEHTEVHICPIMLKAMKFVKCCDEPLMLASYLLLAGQIQLVMTMPSYGTIYITRQLSVDSELSSLSLM